MDKYDSRAIARAIEDAIEEWWQEVNVRMAGKEVGQDRVFRDELRLLLQQIAYKIRQTGT
jgi:hypothetical protein